MAEYLADELKAAGFAADDIKIMPYEGVPGDKTVALIVRWRAAKPTAKPILLMAHMDVVEAKREDWKQDPFEFIERDGYFYGRGSYDNKAGMTGLTMSLLKLKAVRLEAQARPDPVLHRRRGNRRPGRAELGATEWRQADRCRICAQFGRRRRRVPRQRHPARIRAADRGEDVPDVSVDRSQQGRPFQPAAARQCHLRAGDGAEEAGGAPLPADAQRHDTRLFRACGPGRKATARWARRCAPGWPTSRMAPPPTRSKANELEVGLTRTRCVATDAGGRPCRQCPAADGAGDGQLPDHAGGQPGRDPGGVEGRRRRRGRGRPRTPITTAARRRFRRSGRISPRPIRTRFTALNGPDVPVSP